MYKELIEKLKEITPEEEKLIKGSSQIDRRLYMPDNSAKIDSSLLLEQGKLITLRPHTRFVHFPAHTHNYIEMIYMCKGSTRHVIDGHDITLSQGEILILNQNATQEIYPADIDDIAVNFIILPQFFDTALTMMGEEKSQIRGFLIDCLRRENAESSYLLFKVANVLPIQNLVENLIWTLTNHQANKRSINQWTMGLLFLQLINRTDSIYSDPMFKNEHIMMDVLRYIEQHYPDGELRVIAGEMHYDECWLSREIKKRSGKTFTELLQNKRLEQACYLLKSTKLKVSEICQNVGYDSFSYFHRLFLKEYGVSPKKYRDCK